ncbi:MAG: hypothetical protein IKY83_13350 [Proteobacteria bacterium]|nr:hypothetical protein [Pseudomonadota bacterium]
MDTDIDSANELFSEFPDGTRIVIRDGKVIFENLTPDMLDVALSLDPENEELKIRKKKMEEGL